jgi:SAM-dependent methyltransferase
MTDAHSDILRVVKEHYDKNITTHGNNFKSLDYNSPQAQHIRFLQLLKLFDKNRTFSVTDYGCAYGAFANFLVEQGYQFEYVGYDISQIMLDKARESIPSQIRTTLVNDPAQLPQTDYVVASGIFYMNFGRPDEEWKKYILDHLDLFAQKSRIGFAFNVLTKYSDPEKMRSDLYYGDPHFFFDYCRKFTRNVALLHDYELYDFTMLVRLQV